MCVCVFLHSRADREKRKKILWRRTSEYGKRDDFPKSCAREEWDLRADLLTEDREC